MQKIAFYILTVNIFSKRLLTEILRRFAPELLHAVSIADVGNKNDVLKAVRYTLKHTGVNAIGIRDEESTASNSEPIFAYPLQNAPEKEIFQSQSVRNYLGTQYDVSFYDTISNSDDHHNYSRILSRICSIESATIETQCIQAFIAHQAPEKFSTLIENIKKNCN